MHRKAQEFIKYDESAMYKLVKNWNNGEEYIQSVRQEIAIQEQLLREDLRFASEIDDNAWDGDLLRQGSRE
ncbi:MAG: hypothetical protein IT259_05770 [Saprospiraceae bacterium]|nr:hypothetical protein [Saprospiraceae bacterium]